MIAPSASGGFLNILEWAAAALAMAGAWVDLTLPPERQPDVSLPIATVSI
jgi:hypothetical protein